MFLKSVVIWWEVVIQLCTLYLHSSVQERRNVKQKIVASVLSTDRRPLCLATNVCPRARAQKVFIWRLNLLKVRMQTSDVGQASPSLQGKSRYSWLAIYVRSTPIPDSVEVADTEENAGNVQQPDTPCHFEMLHADVDCIADNITSIASHHWDMYKHTNKHKWLVSFQKMFWLLR